MPDTHEKLDQLQTRLEHLEKYEKAFKREIGDIRHEILKLRSGPKVSAPDRDRAPKPPSRPSEISTPVPSPDTEEAAHKPPPTLETIRIPPGGDSNLERFVGTRLISVIGVLVTIIGVGIGAKYAIDNNLISPVMRIAFGYAVGSGLIGVALRLKSKYERFSAVLISGGIAIVYFITYFAYANYALIPQVLAFLLMATLTALAVAAALVYDRRVIAHIGLVGAYAVPFLLSEDSGRADILFSYIAIINIGILAVSVKKYWKTLFYSAFTITWLVFAGWFFNDYRNEQFVLGLTFASVFFLLFYASFLVFKVFHKKPLGVAETSLVIINSLTFFGFGYEIIQSSDLAWALGLLPVLIASLHIAVAALIDKYTLGDRKAVYLGIVLFTAFLAITAPVILDGSWVTIAWMAQGTFLFVIGRIKKIPLFEFISIPTITIASLSLLADWQTISFTRVIRTAEPLTPILNKGFAGSFFVACCFGFAFYVDRLKAHRTLIKNRIVLLYTYALPSAFLIVLYNTFRVEIDTYFYSREIQTAVQMQLPTALGTYTQVVDESLKFFNGILQLGYSMFFVAALGFVNLRKFKSAALGIIRFGLCATVIAVLLTFGIFFLAELREIYVSQHGPDFFFHGFYLIAVRYVAFASAALLLWTVYLEIDQSYVTRFLPAGALKILFNIGLAFTVVVILSNELVTWLSILVFEDIYKLGLSVLWGLYSVTLIVLGILAKRKELRIFAISLFALTLVKLFLYDMADLETIPRTILFVLIGIMLLVASYLYNKYTKLIFGEETKI